MLSLRFLERAKCSKILRTQQALYIAETSTATATQAPTSMFAFAVVVTLIAIATIPVLVRAATSVSSLPSQSPSASPSAFSSATTIVIIIIIAVIQSACSFSAYNGAPRKRALRILQVSACDSGRSCRSSRAQSMAFCSQATTWWMRGWPARKCPNLSR